LNVQMAVAGPEATPARALGGVGFDWAMIGVCTWFIVGGLLDNWAHGHQQLIGTLETFFTPWHAVLYTGWLAVAVFLVAALVTNHARGHPWEQALPPGYGLSLLGVFVFTWGGLADMLWHTFFGIEVGVDATFSPSHIILGIGLVLTMSGPLRAAWQCPPAGQWWAQLPMVLSLTFTLSVVSFFTLVAQPLMNPWAAASRRLNPADLGHTIGIASLLVHTGVLMGFVLLAVLRRPPPFGGLTLLFTLNGIMLAVTSWPEDYRLIPLATTAVAGLAADLLLRQLKPSAGRPGALRLFAFAVPAVFYLVHFLALNLTDGVWWSVHLWAGSIAVAGMVGCLISYVFVPPLPPRS
jgi:hypothetical protein